MMNAWLGRRKAPCPDFSAVPHGQWVNAFLPGCPGLGCVESVSLGYC